MQTSIELRDLFSYSNIPILILLGILLLWILGYGIYLFQHRQKKIVVVPIQTKDYDQIRLKYFNKLNQLQIQVQNGQIPTRKAYQTLSSIIRNFLYEVTNVQVQNYSLQEIERLGIPSLTQLVREYYHPEFAQISEGNVLKSIERTREVMQKWR